jgi:hypothetical protein
VILCSEPSKIPLLIRRIPEANMAQETLIGITLLIDGKKYTGADHKEAVFKYAEENGISFEEAMDMHRHHPIGNTMFHTSNGRTVGPEEAYEIFAEKRRRTGSLNMFERQERQPDKKRMYQEIAEYEVNIVMREEKAGRQNPRSTEKMLDDPGRKMAHPEFRQALLKCLKELGRVPEDKE